MATAPLTAFPSFSMLSGGPFRRCFAACLSPSSSSQPPQRLRGSSSSPVISPEKRPWRDLASSVLLSSGAGLALISAAYAFPPAALPAFEEPRNALSLPTWAIHVSSVVEWIIAMALVWQYGEKSGFEAWKGLSWGMVPLLGGAMCACTWHFFYNSESLEVLVAMQGALTVVGNTTMCIAAFRIFKAYEESSNNS